MTNQAPPSSPGTIDITNVVESLRKTWVDYMVALIIGIETADPALTFLVTVPVLAQLDKALIRLMFDYVSKQAEMMAFFLNTAIRKASQAKDFTDAVDRKYSLPESATPEEFANAEKAQMVAFRRFVMVSN